MGYVLLGLSFALLVLGGFGIFSAFFNRTQSEAKRLGKMLRSMLTELVGLMVFLGGYLSGVKGTFAFLVFFGSLFLGSFGGLLHGSLANRRGDWEKPGPVPEPSEETHS